MYKGLIQRTAAIAIAFMSTASLASAEDAHAFPNPYVASKNSSGGIITITPVPLSGTVKIYTIDGQEVRSLNIETGLGKVEWNTHNTNGKLVGTGVYYFRVNGEGTESVGKLVIIR